MSANKIIIGIVSEIAAGKGTASEYLQRTYSGTVVKYSTMLRDIMKRLYIEPTRADMQYLSTALRRRFGDDLFAKVVAKDVAASPSEFIIADGIRRPSDIVELKKMPAFHLLAIVADERIRFERVKARNENQNDAIKTWDDFQKDAAGETEITIRDTTVLAEFTVMNNGTPEELYAALDAVVAKIKEGK